MQAYGAVPTIEASTILIEAIASLVQAYAILDCVFLTPLTVAMLGIHHLNLSRSTILPRCDVNRQNIQSNQKIEPYHRAYRTS